MFKRLKNIPCAKCYIFDSDNKLNVLLMYATEFKDLNPQDSVMYM